MKMSENIKENVDLGLRLLVAFAACLAIYVSVAVVNDRVGFGLDERQMMYNHDEFIKGEIAKRHHAIQEAKHEAHKHYMETSDTSKMVALDMVLVDANGTIVQDVYERAMAKREAYKYFRDTGDNSLIVKIGAKHEY